MDTMHDLDDFYFSALYSPSKGGIRTVVCMSGRPGMVAVTPVFELGSETRKVRVSRTSSVIYIVESTTRHNFSYLLNTHTYQAERRVQSQGQGRECLSLATWTGCSSRRVMHRPESKMPKRGRRSSKSMKLDRESDKLRLIQPFFCRGGDRHRLTSRSHPRTDDDEALEPDYLLTTPWPSLLDYYPHAGPSRLRGAPLPPSPQSEPYTNGHATPSGSGNASVSSLAALLRK